MAHFDSFCQLSQTFGVEGVRRIEIFETGLVEIDDRDDFKLQPVGGERFGREIANLACVVTALLVHLFERHLGSYHALRRRELALEQAADAVFLQRAPAERLRGGGDGLPGGADTHEEFGNDIDAHAVAGDERAVLATRHLDAHDVHVDRSDFVQHRDDEGAAVDDDLLAQEAGSDEGGLFGGAAIKPAHDVNENDDRDR